MAYIVHSWPVGDFVAGRELVGNSGVDLLLGQVAGGQRQMVSITLEVLEYSTVFMDT